MDCWLNIYKPRLISSAKVVADIKKCFKGQKVGHCGTLDLEAQGILPIAIGEATKLIRVLVEARKKYIFTMQFGTKTNTGDAAGEVIQVTDHLPMKYQCYQIVDRFIGEIEQIPSAFSAIKVNGIRAYILARQCKVVTIPVRKIFIYHLECLDYNPIEKTATYLVECSKGTYVRTLAEDIALSLQSLAFIVELNRIQVGTFTLEDSIMFESPTEVSIETMQKLLAGSCRGIETVLGDIPVLDANREQAKKIIYGQQCYFEAVPLDIDFLWVRYEGKLLAIGSLNKNYFNSSRVFNLIKQGDYDVDYCRS